MAGDEKLEGSSGGVEGVGSGFGGGSGCWDSSLKVKVSGKGSEGLQRAMCRRAPVAVLRELGGRWSGMSADGKWKVGEEVGKLMNDVEVVGVIQGWNGEERRRGMVVVEEGGGREEAKGVVEVFGGMRGVRICVNATEALTMKEMLKVVHEIDISSRSMSGERITTLSHTWSTPSLFPSLKTLNIDRNRIGAAGMLSLSRALSTPGSFSSIHTLLCSGNGIDDDGIVALSHTLSTPGSFSTLHTLGLADNFIGVRGINTFSQVLSIPTCFPSLHTLLLQYNGIRNRGMIALSRALSTPGSCPSLRILDVSQNGIDAAGVEAVVLLSESRPSLQVLH